MGPGGLIGCWLAVGMAPGQAVMAVVNVHQAKTHLSPLLQDVEQGAEVGIARAGVPVVPLRPEPCPVAVPGALRGRIQIGADVDAPLVDLFEGLG